MCSHSFRRCASTICACTRPPSASRVEFQKSARSKVLEFREEYVCKKSRKVCFSPDSKTFDRTDFETHLGSRMVDARTSSRSPFEEDGLCAHMSPQPQQPTACGLLSRSTRFHLSHISGEPFNPHHLPSTTILHQVLTTPVASAESPLKGSRPRFGRERPR